MKRLVRKSEKQGNDWYAYHGMNKEYLDDNLKNGIYPTGDHGDYVYLAADPNVCWAYCGSNGVVLKIKMTKENLEEIKVNNEAFSYDEFSQQYFLNTIRTREGYDIDDNTDISDFIYAIEEYEGKEKAKKIEDEIFKAYFYEAELMVSHVNANQIVEVIK